jgi:hypothetical protein
VFAFRLLFPYGLSVMSRRSVSEALADNALNGRAARSTSSTPAEIKFRKAAMQMFFLTMLIHVLHAAFEDRIVTFDVLV